MRGKAVPQRVRRHPLLDPSDLGGGVDGATELAGRQRLARIAAGKQPASRQQRAELPPLPPPLTQQFEQPRRQHGVAILAALALLDPQQHALGVDVADVERDHLGDAQPGAIGGGECVLYFGPGAAWSSSGTSSTLSTAGRRRGWRTDVSRCTRSGRCNVTVNRKRRAETAVFMFDGCIPLCRWCSGKRRTSSSVAVSGERRMKAANDRTWRT